MTTSFTTGIRRRQNIRLVLFLIILATLPFYCVGFILWGTAPQQRPAVGPGTATVRATLTPLATRTPLGTFVVPTGSQPTLINTPGQFFPPVGQPTFSFATSTFVLFPSSTPAPTLTMFVPPSSTPIPQATNTPIPFASDTPIPDSDGDGVPDNFDPCPSIPYPGTGCPPPSPTPSATGEFVGPPVMMPSDTPLPF